MLKSVEKMPFFCPNIERPSKSIDYKDEELFKLILKESFD